MPNREFRYDTKKKRNQRTRKCPTRPQQPVFVPFFEPKGFYTTSFENVINIKCYYAKICMKLLSNKFLRGNHDTLPERVELLELPVEKHRQY